MGNLNLNGSWKVYYRKGEELNINTYSNGTQLDAEVPSTIDEYLDNRKFYGSFFYERIFRIDRDNTKRYVLSFKGVSYYCQVYLNGEYIGEHEGIWDGFKFDITDFINDGDNCLVVKVIKPDYDLKSKYYFRSVLFGFIPDVLLPFGGIWKDVYILEKECVYFEDIYSKFNMKDSALEIEYRVNESRNLKINIGIKDPNGSTLSFYRSIEKNGILKIKMDSLILWSPKNPNLYTVEVKLISDEAVFDTYRNRLGARSITSKEGRILVNGEPVYLRGVLNWGYYPEIYCPNPSYEMVRQELKRIKEMGFNGIKHCLYFPPEYYYELCDEMGILQWQELPLWLPYQNEYLMDRIFKQYPRMLRLFINHASVILISIGCELDSTIPKDVLNKLYSIIDSGNSQAIICDNSGSGECYEGVKGSKSDIYDYHFYSEIYNLEELINEFTQTYREKKPWLFGEYNDVDTWRDMGEIRDKSRYEIYWADRDERKNLLLLTHNGQASNQPVYMQEDILKRYEIGENVKELKEISYKQAYETRKYILELTRRYSAINGYNITSLRDCAITTSGIFDDFNNPKWEPEEFRRINSDMVLIYTKDLGRIWYRGADRFLSRDLYNHFSKGILLGKIVLSNTTNISGKGNIVIELIQGDKLLYRNTEEVKINAYDSLDISDISIPLPEFISTTSCILKAMLFLDNRMLVENNWEIWVHPNVKNEIPFYLLDNGDYFSGVDRYFNTIRVNSIKELKEERGILVTSYFNKDVERLMEAGWNIFYIQHGYGFFKYKELPFFREGIKRINSHDVLDSLEHNGYAGIQFFSLASDTAFDRLDLKEAIGDYIPIISRYDARKFHASEYMFEYFRGKGKTIATSLRLQGGQGSQARSFEENILSVKILDNIIKYFSK